ncbi:MAG: type II secretion system protein [Methylococcaceae bacterium]
MFINIRYKLRLQTGFTLVELAVVLVIVGILLSSVLGTLGSRIENSRKNETKKQLAEIKLALIGYAYVNGRLPCPDCSVVNGSCLATDVGDGISDDDGAICDEGENTGFLPWSTLGIGQSDSWGTRYSYSVQNEYANLTTPFELSSAVGSAVIQEPDFVADATGGAAQSLATSVVAVIFSHGENGYGGTNTSSIARAVIPAANTDEKENTDDDGDFYMRPETAAGATIAGGEFDDILIWISEFELKAKMVEAGKLP